MTIITSNNWILTDSSTEQYMRQISKTVFEFREQRETKNFTAIIYLENYEIHEIICACEAFRYEFEEVIEWIENGENYELIAKCMFKQLE